jgi:hypothetical protein
MLKKNDAENGAIGCILPLCLPIEMSSEIQKWIVDPSTKE